MYRKNFPERKKKRQEEARARQEKHSKLPLDQKIAKAVAGSRERTRLLELKK